MQVLVYPAIVEQWQLLLLTLILQYTSAAGPTNQRLHKDHLATKITSAPFISLTSVES